MFKGFTNSERAGEWTFDYKRKTARITRQGEIMKKLRILLVLCIVMMNLYGCGNMFNINLSSTENIKKENAAIMPIAEEIVSYIENEDYDSLKAMFAGGVSADMDFDTGYEYTVDLYKGKCVEITDVGTNIGETFGAQNYKTANGLYSVCTSDEEYLLYFIYIPVSDDESDIGLHRMKLLVRSKNADPHTSLYTVYYRNYCGIYNPAWDDEYHANPEKWEKYIKT